MVPTLLTLQLNWKASRGRELNSQDGRWIFSAKDVSHIDKFNGDNFNFYKFKLKLVFENHSLLAIIEGTETKKDVLVADATNSNQAAVSARQVEITAWEQKDTAAQNYIVSTLEDKITRTILNCSCAKLMWDRLLAQYELSSVETKHVLLGKFIAY